MKAEQGYSSLPWFLSASQQDEVMTAWQPYLGFPCLASSPSIPGFNVSGYHIDMWLGGLVDSCTASFWSPVALGGGGGGGEKGTGLSFSGHCPLSWHLLCLSRLPLFGGAAQRSAEPGQNWFPVSPLPFTAFLWSTFLNPPSLPVTGNASHLI